MDLMIEIKLYHFENIDTVSDVRISKPQERNGSEIYICKIESSKDLGFRVDSHGIGPQQAVRLALEIVAARLSAVLCGEITDLPLETKTTKKKIIRKKK